MKVVPSTYHQFVKFSFQGVEVTILANTSYTCNMLKSYDSFVLTNQESIENHVNKMKDVENTTKLNETSMGDIKLNHYYLWHLFLFLPVTMGNLLKRRDPLPYNLILSSMELLYKPMYL